MLNSKILSNAKDLILKHGWIKGNFGNKDVGFCMLGALREVDIPNLEYFISPTECSTPFWHMTRSEAYNLLTQTLHSEYDDNMSISIYNDTVARNVTEVVEMFNRAAALAKLKERA